MHWDDVINQLHVISVLQRSIEQDRLPHAFLFTGPDGCGKRVVALALAQTLQCELSGIEACENCSACRKVARMVHPDVHVLFPQPKATDPHEVAHRLQRMASEPYATIDFARRPFLDEPVRGSNLQATYSVDRVREDVLRPMSYKPSEGRYKVAVLTDADAMNAPAANAFLKMLEEPPPRTIFILTTRHPEALLPTIVSRCQRLRFDALSAEVIEQALVHRTAIDAARAAVIAPMADGSYSRALDLVENEALATSRDQVVEFLRRSYAMDVSRISNLEGRITGLGRENVKAVLNLMLTWIRDLLLFREMGDAALLVNVDQQEAIARFCYRLPEADLTGMAGAVEEAIGLLERNVRTDFLFVRLSFIFHQAMRGRLADSVFVPLSDPGL